MARLWIVLHLRWRISRGIRGAWRERHDRSSAHGYIRRCDAWRGRPRRRPQQKWRGRYSIDRDRRHFAMVALGSFVIAKVVHAVTGLRVSAETEEQGLDLRIHGEPATTCDRGRAL